MSREVLLPQLTPEEQDRFWSRVEITPGCWLWTGAINEDGYGHFRYGGIRTMRKAHRVAYRIIRGVLPAGKVLHHTCDQRRCVNPAHLVPMTHKEHAAFTTYGHGKAKKVCERGHLLTEDVVIHRNHHRYCRLCLKEHRAQFGIVNGANQHSLKRHRRDEVAA
ncbi:MAG: HNH endonuclease [Thermomicrobiales bacterium]|nr:HNH endonuclease [Thermomicrobiales bacterium]